MVESLSSKGLKTETMRKSKGKFHNFLSFFLFIFVCVFDKLLELPQPVSLPFDVEIR